MKNVVYADNNATTRVAPEVVDAMLPYHTEYYGNPSSMHSFGGNIRKPVDNAREQVAELLRADPAEIVFTAGGTEGDNTALQGILAAQQGNAAIITSSVEHPAVLSPCMAFAKKGRKVIETAVSRDGAPDLEELEKSLQESISLVSLMWANNETGVVFPMDEIADRVKAKGIPLHTDAVQAVGKIPIDLQKTPVDMLSLSGHKLHGPKGIGALYIRKGTRFRPFLLGGHQEAGRRSGTENVAGIVGLGKACEMARQEMEQRKRQVSLLRDRLEKELVSRCPDASVNGLGQERLYNTANISFEFIEGESILLLLDEKGICASSGSACSSGSLEPSHVLRAMGLPFTAIHGSIRFSLSHYNTSEDIDAIIEAVPPIVKRLREISPFGK